MTAIAAPLIAPLPGPDRHLDLGTHSLAYADIGAGPPVIFLHGGLMDHSSWGNQLPLAEELRLILPSTRGHGASTGGDLPATYAAFAEDIPALMDGLGLASAHIVGFSDGGCTALELALRAPGRVRSLSLLGTPYHTDNYADGVLSGMAAMQPEHLEQARPVVRELTDKLRARMSVDDWEAYFPRIIHGLWLREPTLELSDLAALTMPTLVVHGENEHSIRLGASEALAAALPKGRLTIIPGATHASAQDEPEAVNAALREHIHLADGQGRELLSGR
ncbi:alpha/beta fold hydrolase [Pseudoroseicyclus tamaricis]|uniref:Alpha/beta hydrolase n=1 Tax=Pseudoroseicyclus tamaricis TaxID=2705421 RepID=A0A6B2K0L3_9RHOB|nr:alpha/beta hydrolase [Pseudoroseicyclus tamaricis]NDV01222.1 alpha/beta hydrolase [Pseudoroseicyclus tamaricis]